MTAKKIKYLISFAMVCIQHLLTLQQVHKYPFMQHDTLFNLFTIQPMQPAVRVDTNQSIVRVLEFHFFVIKYLKNETSHIA